MLRTFVIIALAFVLNSCSSGVIKSPVGQPSDDKPVDFAQYKQWRQRNDPAGQAYAEFKQWEAAYNEWRQRRSQTLAEEQLK